MFDHIELYPTEVSEIGSRADVDTSFEFAGCILDVPIIASPMKDVVNNASMKEICKHGYAFAHRFQPLIGQLQDVAELTTNFGCALPVKNYHTHIDTFAANGIKSFLIDIANGASRSIEQAVKYILRNVPGAYVTTGNVVSKECLIWLRDIGVYAARLGIGLGSACTTKYEAGIYRSPDKILEDCRSVDGIIKILDGGITKPCDMIKAIYLGADCVMIGGSLAACQDSAAQSIGANKIYRGSASFELHQGSSRYVEGAQISLTTSSTIADFFARYKYGLQSGLSYMNCRNLSELHKKRSFYNNSYSVSMEEYLQYNAPCIPVETTTQKDTQWHQKVEIS